MKAKNVAQKKSSKIEKEDAKKITPDEFDSVVKALLSTLPPKKKAKKDS
jgi:hypothetical protein